MKRFLTSLAVFVAAITPLSATNYYFTDSTETLFASNGAEFSAGNLQLGKFTSTFTPSGSNLNAWSANWIAGPTGSFDPSGPDWSASLTLTNNAVFAVGDPLYLWAFNTVSGANREWALLSDPAWKIVANSSLNLIDQFLDFSPATVALFGGISAGRVTTAPALAIAPVPEPATWVSMLTGCAMIVMLGYRRRRRQAA